MERSGGQVAARGDLAGVVEPRDRRARGRRDRCASMRSIAASSSSARRDVALGDQRGLVHGVHPAGLVGERQLMADAVRVPRTATVAARCPTVDDRPRSNRASDADQGPCAVATFLLAATAQTVATTMQARRPRQADLRHHRQRARPRVARAWSSSCPPYCCCRSPVRRPTASTAAGSRRSPSVPRC